MSQRNDPSCVCTITQSIKSPSSKTTQEKNLNYDSKLEKSLKKTSMNSPQTQPSTTDYSHGLKHHSQKKFKVNSKKNTPLTSTNNHSSSSSVYSSRAISYAVSNASNRESTSTENPRPVTRNTLAESTNSTSTELSPSEL